MIFHLDSRRNSLSKNIVTSSIPEKIIFLSLVFRYLTGHREIIQGFIMITINNLLNFFTQSSNTKIKSFMDPPELKIQQIFKDERFPNVVVTPRGTVLSSWGCPNIRVRRSEDGGESWGREIAIARSGFNGGGTTINEANGEIFIFVEDAHPPAPSTIYHSKDDGKTWKEQKVQIDADSSGKQPSMHMNEHGITLQHSKYKGRLLRPTRFYGEGNRPESLWPTHFTNAIFSDDGGETWQTSEPFPENGTGEAAITELSDGRIYYNSRRHWAPEGKNPRRRWIGWSHDGGMTWKETEICEVLPDGPQNSNYGCMGGLSRLRLENQDILIYSNCDSADSRTHGTVWASFDGGLTWPLKRLVYEGNFAYSSIDVGRPETVTESWIYLHFESEGAKMARFNLSWLLEGESTGDGESPSLVNF